METTDQNTNPAVTSLNDKLKPRMPFKEVTVRPRQELRQRILDIQLKTGKTANVIMEELLCAAAGMPIEWTVITPQNGPDAGVSLNEVEKALTNVFFAVREVKGIVKNAGPREAHAKIDGVVNQAMVLWAHAQSLAKATFYNDVRLTSGRRVWKLVSNWKINAQAALEKELSKKDAADAASIQDKKNRISDYDEVLPVLTRLGFSPAGPVR